MHWKGAEYVCHSVSPFTLYWVSVTPEKSSEASSVTVTGLLVQPAGERCGVVTGGVVSAAGASR